MQRSDERRAGEGIQSRLVAGATCLRAMHLCRLTPVTCADGLDTPVTELTKVTNRCRLQAPSNAELASRHSMHPRTPLTPEA